MTRRYLKAEQWRQLIAEQAAGDGSGVDFCQRNGLTPKSFCRRRKALRDEYEHESMVAVAPPTSLASTRQMAASWRGVELALSGSASPAWVAQLMQELTDASVS